MKKSDLKGFNDKPVAIKKTTNFTIERLPEGLYYGKDGRRLKKPEYYNKMSKTKANKGRIKALRQKEMEFAHEISRAYVDSEILGILGDMFKKLQDSGKWFNFEHFVRTINHQKELNKRARLSGIEISHDFTTCKEAISRALKSK